MADEASLHVSDYASDYVREIQAIGAVPRVLETVAALTGLRFTCIAHVTATSWTACAVHDRLGFGIKPGDQLAIQTTICQEVHDTREAVIIDDAHASDQVNRADSARLYGFRGYVAIPIYRRDGFYFGTLCGIDPEPVRLSQGPTVAALTLFAELVSCKLESERSLREAHSALLSERETAELREQFIAVLGHDLRTPLNAILNRAELLFRRHEDAPTRHSLERIRASALRIEGLVDNVVDFTRGRMGAGLALDLRMHAGVDVLLEQVVEELRAAHPERELVTDIETGLILCCDLQRMAQLLSNLVKNALVHGTKREPVRIRAHTEGEHFYLTVGNDGEDLSPDVIGQLFKPYWRAISRTGDDGLGLGLYIVDQIARGHHGSIGVTSHGGHTTFTFTMAARSIGAC